MDKKRLIIIGLLFAAFMTGYVVADDVNYDVHWSRNADEGFVYTTVNSDNLSMNNNSLLWLDGVNLAGVGIDWNAVTGQFDATGGGGGDGSNWTRSGTTLFPTNDGDDAQVNGTINASNGEFSYLDVGNDVNVTGTLTIVGYVDVDGYIISDLLPSNTLTYSLGSGPNRWLALFVADVSSDTLNATVSIGTGGDLWVGGDIDLEGDISLTDITVENITIANEVYMVADGFRVLTAPGGSERFNVTMGGDVYMAGTFTNDGNMNIGDVFVVTVTGEDRVNIDADLYLNNNTLFHTNLTEFTSSGDNGIYLDNDKFMTNFTGGGTSLWSLDDAINKIFSSNNYDIKGNGSLSVEGRTYMNDTLDMNRQNITNVNLSGNVGDNMSWDYDDMQFDVVNTGWLQNGFPNIVDSSISFADGNRTFMISSAAGSFDYYIASVKYNVVDTDTVVIDDIEGLWYIYYDESTLTALHSPTHAQLETLYLTKAPVGILYWDSDNSKGQLLEERHGLSMSPYTHLYLHETIGTRYASGLALNSILADEDGDTDTHAQFGTDVGEIFDEDIEHNISAVGSTTGLQIWYRDTTLWTFTTNAGFSVLTTGSGRLAWDNSGTLTEVTNGNFVLCHVFVGSFSHNKPVVAIGQAEYATKKLAQEAAVTEINNIVSIADVSPELKPIATVIFQTSNSYGNSVKARIVSTDEGDDYVDWTASDLSPGRAASVHGNLAGLLNDDHTQYFPIDGSRNVTGATTFEENVTIADTMTYTNSSSVHHMDIYLDENGVLVWKWD